VDLVTIGMQPEPVRQNRELSGPARSRHHQQYTQCFHQSAFAIIEKSPMNNLTHLECSLCKKTYEAGKVHNLCDCGGPLLVRYDLEKARKTWNRDEVAKGPDSMWRYSPMLPPRTESIVSLGEGMTPLVRTPRLGSRVGADDLW